MREAFEILIAFSKGSLDVLDSHFDIPWDRDAWRYHVLVLWLTVTEQRLTKHKISIAVVRAKVFQTKPSTQGVKTNSWHSWLCIFQANVFLLTNCETFLLLVSPGQLLGTTLPYQYVKKIVPAVKAFILKDLYIRRRRLWHSSNSSPFVWYVDVLAWLACSSSRQVQSYSDKARFVNDCSVCSPHVRAQMSLRCIY